MRYLYFILALTFTLNASAQASGALACEKQRFAAMIAADTVALDHLLADEMIYIHSNALLETKPAFLHSISTRYLIYESFKPETVQVQQYGRKTAVLTGIVQAKGKLNGNAFDIRLRYTSVYRKKHGHWQMTNWQSGRM